MLINNTKSTWHNWLINDIKFNDIIQWVKHQCRIKNKLYELIAVSHFYLMLFFHLIIWCVSVIIVLHFRKWYVNINTHRCAEEKKIKSDREWKRDEVKITEEWKFPTKSIIVICASEKSLDIFDLWLFNFSVTYYSCELCECVCVYGCH